MIEFEWDQRKQRINLRKHGIDFVDAAKIFEGEIVVIPDDRIDYGEMRYIALGLLLNQLILVAYTERGESVRLISARKATKNEENYYFKQIAH